MAHDTEQPGSVERKEDFGKDKPASVGMWLAEIRSYEATFKTWTKRAEKIIERYRDEAQDQDDDFSKPASKFAVLWSNVQTLQPIIYSRMPKADIRRRHKDKDAVARAAAVILERAVETEMEEAGFNDAMVAARDDYLLVARGTSWVRYVPEYGDETKERIYLQQDTATGAYKRDDGLPVEGDPQFDDAGDPFVEGEPYSPVVKECVKVDHVGWADFGHTPAPNWDKVRAVWKKEYLTRDQLIERFGAEKGKAIDLQRAVPNIKEEDKTNYGDTFKRAEVYEIWDRSTKKVVWISPGYSDGPLDEIDDPLGLKDFFPCPRPFYGTLTTDSLVPIPDYSQYRVQAEEIDRLTQRIQLLTKALSVKGAYNSELTELQRLVDANDNTLVPVDNWAAFAETNGFDGNIAFLPVAEIANVLVQLIQIREQMKRDLFEVTGISDLVRGQGQASETATAQRIKGHYAGLRIEDRQRAQGRFAGDVVRIMAEIMAEHFSPETLLEMSGWQHTEESAALDEAHDAWMEAQAQLQQQQMAEMQAQMQQQMGGGEMGIGPGVDPAMMQQMGGEAQGQMMPQQMPPMPGGMPV